MDTKYTSIKFSAKEYFYIISAIILTIFGLSVARGFLIPICFAVLLSFILLPVVRFLEEKGIHRVFSIILTFLMVILLVGGISFFFSSQIAAIISDFESFKARFDSLLNTLINMYNKEFKFLPHLDTSLVLGEIASLIKEFGGQILGSTITQTTVIVTNMVLTPIYMFLLLLYRRGLLRAILMFFKKEQRPEVEDILYEVQGVGKDYIVGLFTVVLILAIINSTFLLIIGIDYAIMFGCLSALLIIIPYVGPYVGAMLPIMYALVTLDPSSTFVILICFICSHLLESNYLTPKIVGSNTSVNALVAFLALVLGGTLWGISGMILAIPFIAMLKKVFMRVSGLRPLGLLLGEEVYAKKEMKIDELDIEYIQEKEKTKLSLYRLIDRLKGNKSSKKD